MGTCLLHLHDGFVVYGLSPWVCCCRDAEELQRVLDANGDGKVTLEELLATAAQFVQASTAHLSLLCRLCWRKGWD
jgi:hypothetical protein